MEFAEKLIRLRRREGLSQEQLAGRLGVTRQSVSKWESGAAMPELGKLIILSEYFSVSVDYLVKEGWEEPAPQPEAGTARLEAKVDDLARYFRGYAYDSKTRLWGLPLVSVRFNRRGVGRGSTARGIIAIGNGAVGVVAIGGLSCGAVSLGGLSLGVVSLGMVAAGAAALGAIAVGITAFGSCAIGIWSGGVAVLGREIAVGVAALGKTAVGYDAAGQQVLLWGDGLTASEVEVFLRRLHPRLWQPLLKVLSFLGGQIK